MEELKTFQEIYKKRPFATGSKPGPDQLDHYLEERGLYRKHVARDASSLFRAVSEQVLDVQLYHEKVREDVVSFMNVHIQDYAHEVDKNFYHYLSNLRRNRTPGTLLELRAMANMYKKNVVLFEPTPSFETTERFLVYNDAYDNVKPIRVFYSQKDKHFDTVFTLPNIERLADSQSIVHEVLYVDIYKLPDVKYAVEIMLHDQDGEKTRPLVEDPTKYINAAGQVIAFDGHKTTNCVLKDPRTCHFHNQVDFEEVVDEYKDAITIINRSDNPGRLKIFKPIDGFLYSCEKSCVRQLLDEKITPFPYKVAKALDASIYRNTEFELWSENRKEQRTKWFDSNGLPVNDFNEKNWNCYGNFERKKIYDSPFIESDIYITVDENGKKKHFDDFNLDYLTSIEHFQPAKNGLEAIVMPFHVNNRYKNRRNGYYRNNYQQNHGNNDVNRENHQYYEQNHAYAPPQQVYSDIQETYQYVQYDTNTSPTLYQNQPVHQYYNSYVPSHQIQPPFQNPPPSFMPYTGQSMYPYPPPAHPQVQNNIPQKDDPMNLIRDHELAANIDWNPKESVEANGTDLPLNNLQTLQFYYNLGVRYLIASGVHRRLEGVVNQLESIDINHHSETNNNDGNSKQDPPPPVPANTPVTTKLSNSNNYPHRYQHNNNNNYNGNRRQFNQNRDGGKDGRNRYTNQRKEIQFNSNVKNLHKADSNFNKGHTHNPMTPQNQQNSLQTSQTPMQAGNSNSVVPSLQLPQEKTFVSQQQQAMTTPTFALPALSPLTPAFEQQYSTAHYSNVEQPQYHPQPSQYSYQLPQYYAYQTTPNYVPSQVAPTQQMVYVHMENGEYMAASQQPIYYQVPSTPIFYQPQLQQQNQQHSLPEGYNNSDSGLVDGTHMHAYNQQPAFPVIYTQQAAASVCYPQTQMIQATTPHLATATPQIVQSAPVFPVIAASTTLENIQTGHSAQSQTVSANDTSLITSSQSSRSSSTSSNENLKINEKKTTETA